MLFYEPDQFAITMSAHCVNTKKLINSSDQIASHIDAPRTLTHLAPRRTSYLDAPRASTHLAPWRTLHLDSYAHNRHAPLTQIHLAPSTQTHLAPLTQTHLAPLTQTHLAPLTQTHTRLERRTNNPHSKCVGWDSSHFEYIQFRRDNKCIVFYKNRNLIVAATRSSVAVLQNVRMDKTSLQTWSESYIA